MFLVTTPPSKGALLYLTDDGRYETTSNFTQQNINEKRIFYDHQAPVMHIKDFDHFDFEAVAEYAPYRLKSVFNIFISLSTTKPGGIDKYIKMNTIVCGEGGNVTLFTRNLNTTGIMDFIRSNQKLEFSNSILPIRMKLTTIPLQGVLSLRGGIGRQGDTFTQQDIDSGRVFYTHDHSDTTEDRIGFAVYLLGDLSGSNDILLFSGKLNISITSVNDRMPFLVTKNPSMVVVRGQTKPIVKDMLEVQDPDTSPQEIKFTILDNGLQGRLVYLGREARSITHFSQEDINQGRVVYIHDGASTQTQFYFSVTDGRFQPMETGLSRHFRIHVIPLTLELKNNSAVMLDQGTITAIITNANMGFNTNGDKSKVQYRVTSNPVAGQILVEDRPTNTFTQVPICLNFYYVHISFLLY